MELKTKIKASNINNLSDARYFSTFAEWIGFNFNPANPNALNISVAKELIGWLAGPRIVGEFDTADITLINEACTALKIDIIQVDKAVEYKKLSPSITTIIQRVIVKDMASINKLPAQLDKIGKGVAYILLDFQTNKLTWENLQAYIPVLQQLTKAYHILLHISCTPENVVNIVDTIQPFALNLSGGQELKIGLRAFDDIDPIIEQLEIEEEWAD